MDSTELTACLGRECDITVKFLSHSETLTNYKGFLGVTPAGMYRVVVTGPKAGNGCLLLSGSQIISATPINAGVGK